MSLYKRFEQCKRLHQYTAIIVRLVSPSDSVQYFLFEERHLSYGASAQKGTYFASLPGMIIGVTIEPLLIHYHCQSMGFYTETESRSNSTSSSSSSSSRCMA